jgi:DNA-binding NarL/FixJ family response regulator
VAADTGKIRVVIIEDRKEIRAGLVALIGGTPEYSCVGNYSSIEEALSRIEAAPPDVALVDIGLPGMSGIEGIRLLRERHPAIAFLVMTVYDDDNRIFNALCAGATGYLLKRTTPARLLESIAEVAQGGAPMSPEVARRVVELFRQFHPPEKADYQLTPHEVKILKLLVAGHNYKTAAIELGVSLNTVSFHVKHIYEKLQVHSKSEAVAKALRGRLTE